MLNPVRFGDHDDSFVADDEASLAVALQVIADFDAGRNANSLVDDGPPDFRMPADFDPLEQDRIAHLGVAVDPDPRADDRSLDQAAGNDAPLADDAIRS